MQISKPREALLNSYIKTGQLIRFYKSREWRTLREAALRRDNYECKKCKTKGRYRHADCVHHIKEVKLWPGGALLLGNLTSLCNSCHNEAHGRNAEALNQKHKHFTTPERW